MSRDNRSEPLDLSIPFPFKISDSSGSFASADLNTIFENFVADKDGAHLSECLFFRPCQGMYILASCQTGHPACGHERGVKV